MEQRPEILQAHGIANRVIQKQTLWRCLLKGWWGDMMKEMCNSYQDFKEKEKMK